MRFLLYSALVLTAGLAAKGPSPVPIPVQAACKANSAGTNDCRLAIYVQPYKGVGYSLAGEKVTGKISQIDKTLARVDFTLKGRQASESTAVLSLSETRTGATAEALVHFVDSVQGETPLIALNSPGFRHRLLKRIAVGKQPKSAMFISPTRVVLPLLDDNHSEVVDIATGQIFRLELPKKYAKRGGFVESVRVPPLREFWVSQMKAAAIHRFDTDTLEYKGSIDLTGEWTKVLAYDQVRNVVYASNWNSADISVVSVSSLKETRKIKLGGVPRGMAFSSDGKFMLAAIFGGQSDSDRAGRTVKVDLDKQKIVETIISGGSHRHAIRLKDGTDEFAVSDMARSTVYYISDYAKAADTKVYNNPNTIAESPDGKYLYVSCRGRNNPKGYLLKGLDFGHLMVIDLKTRKVVEDIEAGNQPTGLDISPDGKFIVLTDFLDHAMRVYERIE